MTTDQVKQKIQQARSQGVPDKEIFNYLNNKGLIPSEKVVQSAPVQEKKVGGLQSFIQSVAEPFLKVPTTVAAGLAVGGARIFGSPNTVEKMRDTTLEGLDYGYFGNVKPIGAGAFEKYQAGDIGGGEFVARAGADVVGTAAEIGSNFVGGTGAVGAVKTGLKGLVREGVKEGVKVGAKSGALLSFGDSLQDAESKPMDVAYNTLFGTGVGAVAGGVFGAATPVVAKAVKETSKFLKVPELQNKLADGYRKIFNPTARQVKIDTRFGNDSFKFLSEELPDLPIQVNSSGRIEADDAIEMAKLKYSAEAAAYKPIIRNSGKYVDIDNAINEMKAVAKKEFDGSDLLKAEQQIESEVESFLRNNPQDINVTQSGKRFVTLSRADDIKSYSWARGKGWGTPEAEVWNDTNNIIGHTLKEAIEKELPEAPIKAMNKRLGQWKNAIDLLEKRNGQVSGSGGKLSKYITRAVGTSIGASLGTGEGIGDNLTGAGTGFLTATALASMMSNPNVRLYVVRKLLNNLAKSGRKDMIQEAEEILKSQAQRYLLPAAGKSSYVEKPIVLPKNIRETNLGLDEVRNMKSSQSQPKPLAITEPTQAPTTQANMKDNIKEIIPQSAKNIQSSKDSIARYKEILADPKSDAQDIAFAKRGIEGEMNYLKNKGITEAYGGVAGIEVTKDENGEVKVNFNKEKALAGIIGMTSAKKVTEIQNLAKNFLKREPPYGLLQDLKAFVKYHDFKQLPRSEKNADIFKKDIRTTLEKFGVDSFNMSDRKIADFSDAVIERADKVPKFKQNPATGKLEGSIPATQSKLIQEAKKYKGTESLKKIGSGSDRDVFQLSNDLVVKKAKNELGKVQNSVLANSAAAQDAGLLPKVYKRGDDFIVTDFVKKPDLNTQKMVKEILNINMKRRVAVSEEVYKTKLNKLVNTLNKYGYNGNAIRKYADNMSWGDFEAISNWGTLKGKPIHIDEGTFDGEMILRTINERTRANQK